VGSAPELGNVKRNRTMTDTPETDAARLTEKNGCILTIGGNQVVPAEFARRLERERDEARKEAAMWKANHDNQVELKSIISKRGDLKDRAPRVEKLIAERNQLRASNVELAETLEEVLSDWNEGHGHTDTASFLYGWELLTKIKEEQP
jgi:hypothetical protein